MYNSLSSFIDINLTLTLSVRRIILVIVAVDLKPEIQDVIKKYTLYGIPIVHTHLHCYLLLRAIYCSQSTNWAGFRRLKKLIYETYSFVMNKCLFWSRLWHSGTYPRNVEAGMYPGKDYDTMNRLFTEFAVYSFAR